MRLYGFRTAGFAGQTAEQAVESIVRAGYGCAEICLDGHGLLVAGADDLRRLVRRAGESGLGIASFSYHGDGLPVAERWHNLGQSLELTAACDVPILVINGDRDAGGPPAPGAYEFVTRAAPLAERAAALGVRLAVEPEPGTGVAGLTDMLRVLAEMSSPPVAVNLDIGHIFLTDEVGRAFRDLGMHIVHLHLEDIQAPVHKHLLPGDGDMPFGAVASLAESIGYSGPWVIDLFRLEGEPVAYAAKALLRLRERLELA